MPKGPIGGGIDMLSENQSLASPTSQGSDPGHSVLTSARWGAAAVAAVGGAAVASAQSAGGAASIDPGSSLGMLLDRITYFPTVADRGQALSLGYEGYLEQQLAPESLDDWTDGVLRDNFKFYVLPISETNNLETTTTRRTLSGQAIFRAAHSPRQLLQRMVEFWSDHFNIPVDNQNHFRTVYDRDVIRVHALGNFKSLLMAVAKSTSMLSYLNGNTNVRTAPNENFARELLELHTFGVDNGYTMADIKDIARCFTGWRFNTTSSSPLYYQFEYNHSNHDTGAKAFLGTTLPAGGNISDGEYVIDFLSKHVNTARFVCWKLCRFFLSYNPPTWIVDQAASVFLSSNGDIKQVLRVILSEKSMLTCYEPKLKRPFHLTAGMLRAVNLTVSNYTTYGNLVDTWVFPTGNAPFRWQPPNGYPDTSGYWKDLLLPRWNFAFALLNSQISGASVTMLNAAGSTSTDRTTFVNALLANVFFGRHSDVTRSMLLNYRSTATISSRDQQELVALAFASSQFQWH